MKVLASGAAGFASTGSTRVKARWPQDRQAPFALRARLAG
ncbi:MAG: hypothetical protein QOJ56_1989 [Mycobacterium sp.]|jgi:hypothetical protein|nr:hypothetical protein [Mycobacterium sp.]